MNSPMNPTIAIPESSAEPQLLAPARPLYWSVRRELWENRSIYLAPLAVAALYLFGFLLSTVRLPAKMRAVAALAPAKQLAAITQPYNIAALLIMATTFLVGVFYCLDALHGERRDRSILFWKSLPVSDRTTVLAKASIPFVLLPLLTFAITAATQWLMLLLSSAVLLVNGMSASALWTQLPFVRMTLMLLYHLLVVHGLYYAPIYAWLLLVSGWARRATFLWAVLPPLAIGMFERIAFNSAHFAGMLGSRMSGGSGPQVFPSAATHEHAMLLDPLQFLSSPSLWLGLVLAAAFLAAAVRVRRNREPI